MRTLKILVLALGAMPLAAAAQQQTPLTEVVDKIVAQEQAEVQALRQYSPIVETYIQMLRTSKDLGAVPNGDKYFLGRADLANGVELVPLVTGTRTKHNMFGGLGSFFSVEFLPRGFLQMIYVDTNGFDRQHYKFDYVGREFLGEVRCLVFDVDPSSKGDKGRFVGRIWVEDQDYHIVRFNGGYSSRSKTSYYFSFDSWRTNDGNNEWLPAYIYSEEGDNVAVNTFKAQTRLWGYAPSRSREEQELSKVLVETPRPVNDQTEKSNDYSPLQAKRAWARQAEDNIAAKMEQLGLMAPYGDVDKVLETVINNLEVTNNLDIQPAVRCRVLMTSTLESFTMGHTIVLSRGLVDVLPDEVKPCGHPRARTRSRGARTSYGRAICVLQSPAVRREGDVPPLWVYFYTGRGTGGNPGGDGITEEVAVQGSARKPHNSSSKHCRTVRRKSPTWSVRTWATASQRPGRSPLRLPPRSRSQQNQRATSLLRCRSAVASRSNHGTISCGCSSPRQSARWPKTRRCRSRSLRSSFISPTKELTH